MNSFPPGNDPYSLQQVTALLSEEKSKPVEREKNRGKKRNTSET